MTTIGIAAGAAGPATADPEPRRRRLARVEAASAGVDPLGIVAFVDAVNEKVGGLHSFMLLRHGQVAAEAWWEPYAPQYPHMLYSLSKSFTSTAVGLAVSEGRLTVDAPVVSFFPDDLPAEIGANLAAMRVRHLLSMSTGHDKDATGPTTEAPDGNWARAFLALKVEHEPGTHFVYNSAATYMLSAIVQKRVGATVLDYLKPRLFGPIGIDGETWETCPRGINTGGWGLSVKTEDIARFGHLYLQKGLWDGRRLLPESWVLDATSKHISNGTDPNSDWAQGYGYQFWRCRHGAYRGDGAFGQYCVVLPEQDAVVAITSGVQDMQAVLTAIWDHLLPAMHAGPLPAENGAVEIKRRLARLSVPFPVPSRAPAAARRVSGHTYRFPRNDGKLDSIRVEFERSRCRMVVHGERGESRVECGNGAWIRGVAPAFQDPDPHLRKVAARGSWTAPDTYTATLCYYETPYVQTASLRFGPDTVTLHARMNVGFGPTEQPELTGTLGDSGDVGRAGPQE